MTDSDPEQEIAATNGFADVKAQKHQTTTSAPMLEAQTESSGSWENNKIKEKALELPLLWKIRILTRKINIRLVLNDDNYQHVKGFMASPLLQQKHLA